MKRTEVPKTEKETQLGESFDEIRQMIASGTWNMEEYKKKEKLHKQLVEGTDATAGFRAHDALFQFHPECLPRKSTRPHGDR